MKRDSDSGIVFLRIDGVDNITLWQGGINSSATSPMSSLDAETDVKLNIIIIIHITLIHAQL